jgi:glyoxylase-like metal-dependent hydrolase (beta-lactamase superfamily II)
MRQITEQVHIFPFFGSFLNIYLVETPEGLLLVDTGLSSSQIDRIASELKRSGRSLNDIRHIFITHAHNDHIGGLHYLQKQLPATTRTYAHRREAAIIRGEAPMIFAHPKDLKGLPRLLRVLMPEMRVTPSRVDGEVKEGDLIGGMLRVVEFPGHAYGQCGLWWEEKRLLIGGDVMARFPWGLGKPMSVATPDMSMAVQSIKKAADMNVDVLCLGHGAPILGNASTKMKAFAARLS